MSRWAMFRNTYRIYRRCNPLRVALKAAWHSIR